MFLYHQWTELNINTRHKIAAQFGIVKKGSTEVVDNQIKSDGYAVKEIEQALNLDALQTFLDTQETDIAKLWVMLVDKIEGREKVDDIQPPVQEPKIERPSALLGMKDDEATLVFKNGSMIGVKKNKGGRPKKHE